MKCINIRSKNKAIPITGGPSVEVHAIVDDLAEQLSRSGERWLHASATRPKYFEFTPVELYAVTERMSLAEPTHELSADITHLVEFLHCVKNLKIRGARGYIGSSNIVWNALPFSLHLCKNVLALWFTDCDVKMVSGLVNIRKTAKRVVVHYSMKKIEDLLLENSNVDDPNLLERWQRVEEVDFSFNDIDSIHSSIVLLKTMQRLNLSHNKIVSIGDQLQHLAFLTELDLSHNAIADIDEWHTKLGNIKTLNLAGNKIANIHGLRRLFSLQTLDLSDNVISEIESASAVGSLPILEKYDLRGNSVLNTIEYRTRVFESFGDRFTEVSLDGRKADERERDTVAVRLALQKAKNEREDLAKLRQLQIDERIRFLSGEEHVARSI
uniref:Leucine-rich repeat domain-containing protein n=1 Tax=Steinernema glaseri TaxID=37863 RepID=A0A1I7ZX64_9BILA